MPVTQYIGSRYVPLFADPAEWSDTKTYEPLTIVLHQGNSFTSKQFVPVGIDIDNTDFWLETGNYNAQIEQYRNEVVSLKNNLYVTPQMYGAIANGIHDDTDAIKACVNSGNKYIVFPDGDYVVTDTITLPDDLTVNCYGVIHKVGTIDHLFEVGNNSHIELNLEIGKPTAQDFSSSYSADIYIYQKTNVTIKNTVIKNTDSRYAIWIEKSNNITVQNTTIDTYVYTAIGNRDGTNNLKVLFNTILNGHGTNTNRYPIALNSSEAGSISNCIECIGNYIEDRDPMWEGIDAHNLMQAVISNNIVINTLSGISLVPSGGVLQNIIISNNILLTNVTAHAGSSQNMGIAVVGTNDSKYIVICGNTISGYGNNANSPLSSRGGIRLEGVSQSLVYGNTVELVTGYGIRFASRESRNSIQNKIYANYIKNCDIGFKVDNRTDLPIDADVYDNTFDTCVVGISGNTYSDTHHYNYRVLCKNNNFENCTTETENLVNGTITSPTTPLSPAWGREGDYLVTKDPYGGYTNTRCVVSGGDNTPAVWHSEQVFYSLHGTYHTSSSGAFVLTNDRFTTITYAIASIIPTSTQRNYNITCKCVNGSCSCWVTDGSGAAVANEDVEIIVMFSNRSI